MGYSKQLDDAKKTIEYCDVETKQIRRKSLISKNEQIRFI